ncbi:MAG TPA: 50S ribosomal protein L4 [Candidatus Nanoarchaeia archaeon]|nr:50S ribosomal protein L4 [Candidatus Nanoarchaeia archaeon]
MKLVIVDSKNQEKGSVELPSQFEESVRSDLIHRAVVAMQSNRRQPYGSFELSGLQHSIDISKRRRDYKGVYGVGQSRTPRKILSRSGTRMNWVGAFGPQTVGGRQAHPPKASKIWFKKINEKERRKAIRSAIAATVSKEMVQERGHKIPSKYPVVVDSSLESLSKTKDVTSALIALGFGDDLERASQINIRAGKGKGRGRPYSKRKGPLIVIAKLGKFTLAAKNIPGVDVVEVKNLNPEVLAPGSKPGRATIWTQDAIEKIAKENLFR